MIARTILIFLIFASLIFETTIFSFPAITILSLILYIYYPDFSSLIVIFVATLILDMLRLIPIPTSFIFLILLFIAIDYLRRSLDFADVKSTMLIVFIGAFVYARLFEYYPSVLLYGLVFVLTFFVLDFVTKKYLLT